MTLSPNSVDHSVSGSGLYWNADIATETRLAFAKKTMYVRAVPWVW